MKFAKLLAIDGFCFWRVFAVTYPFSCSNTDLKVSSTVAPGQMQCSRGMSENLIFAMNMSRMTPFSMFSVHPYFEACPAWRR